MNEVKLKGKIVGVTRTGKYSSFTLMTFSNGFRCFPRLYVLDKEQKQSFDKTYNVGDMVTVKARLQTARRHPPTIVPYSIEPTKRVFEEAFGVKTGVFESDENEVKLQGEITHVYIPPASTTSLALATIKTTEDNGRNNFPVVTLFGQDANTAETLQENTRIGFIGRIQTHSTDKGGKKQYFESVVGSIAKI